MSNDLSTRVLSQVTQFTKYAKYLPEEKRREAWFEIVIRNRNMHISKYPFLREEIEVLYENFVIQKKVLPSMRSAQFAGAAIELNNARIYNCCYLPIDNWRAFHETMFLLLGGSGVGYSVQTHHINNLPSIRKPTKRQRFVVSDDIIGWAEAIKAQVRAYLDGKYQPEFEFGGIRPKGALLKTSGGRAPGPEPLKLCLKKIKEILESKDNGARITALEAHDVQCFIADAVLAGGIRRAAMIALFNKDDTDMSRCKSNFAVEVIQESQIHDRHEVFLKTTWNDREHNLQLSSDDYKKLIETKTLPWWMFEPQRGRANNSAIFIRHKVKKKDFFDFWDIVEANKSGDPGIYFSNNSEWGCNPCCEIGLRAFQFCNVVEVNCLGIGSQGELNARVKAAAAIGTIQAGYTDFHYLRNIWKKTTERDALLGVSLTGIMSIDYKKLDFEQAALVAVKENERVAKILGINPAARVTCIKPAGTTSCILGCSSGVHAWQYPRYIRRMEINKNESIYSYLKEKIPGLLEDKIGNPGVAFITIPIKMPEDGKAMPDETALEFLSRVKHFSDTWISPGHIRGDNSHNVSATANVRDHEWKEVGDWMWENRESFNGIAILPMIETLEDSTHTQMPFEPISEEKFQEMSQHLKSINLSEVIEDQDNTTRAEEPACAGGVCETT